LFNSALNHILNLEVSDLAEPVLKNRTRFTSSSKNELIPLFNKLSEDSRITKTKLLDEAIEDLLKKHKIRVLQDK